MTEPLDLAYVHSHFPALTSDWAFFDNAGGSQTLHAVPEKITEFLMSKNVQIGGSYERSLAAADALMQGRIAAQTLVNAARAEEIVFGPSTTALLQTLAAGIRSQFQPGDEIIVTIADHESNIGPWDRLREYGVVVKVWPLDHDSYCLRLEDLEALMTERTKMVCVAHVSNILGHVHPIKEIAQFVHDRGALICVDAVAYAPHRAIDVRAWNVDFYVFSFYKAYGPHYAMMYGKYDLLAELDGQYHYFYDKDKVPGKLEPGNPNYELAYSVTAITEYIIALGAHQGATGTDREKIEVAFEAITAHENALTARLLDYLNGRNDCRVIGKSVIGDSARVPTISFKFDSHHSGDIARAADAYKVAIRFGDFHSRRLVEDLKESNHGGVLRVSMVHYNTLEQVDRLTTALTEIAVA